MAPSRAAAARRAARPEGCRRVGGGEQAGRRLAQAEVLGVGRQQRCDDGVEHRVEEDDRADEENEATHGPSTVAPRSARRPCGGRRSPTGSSATAAVAHRPRQHPDLSGVLLRRREFHGLTKRHAQRDGDAVAARLAVGRGCAQAASTSASCSAISVRPWPPDGPSRVTSTSTLDPVLTSAGEPRATSSATRSPGRTGAPGCSRPSLPSSRSAGTRSVPAASATAARRPTTPAGRVKAPAGAYRAGTCRSARLRRSVAFPRERRPARRRPRRPGTGGPRGPPRVARIGRRQTAEQQRQAGEQRRAAAPAHRGAGSGATARLSAAGRSSTSRHPSAAFAATRRPPSSRATASAMARPRPRDPCPAEAPRQAVSTGTPALLRHHAPRCAPSSCSSGRSRRSRTRAPARWRSGCGSPAPDAGHPPGPWAACAPGPPPS